MMTTKTTVVVVNPARAGLIARNVADWRERHSVATVAATTAVNAVERGRKEKYYRRGRR